MTALIIAAILGFWFLLAAVLVVSASMMSARISHLEEGSGKMVEHEQAPAGPMYQGRTAPTRPRASIVR